jgi:ferritin
MPEKSFAQALNEQIGSEFAAHQAYLAAAIHYDDLTMPRMAGFFYRQALEERSHAMMIVQYLLDTEADVTIPGAREPKGEFKDIVEPVRIALEQERKVTAQFNELATLARAESDFQGEQFLQWFLKEQVEEVALMTDLLAIVEQSKDRPLDIEEFLAREGLGEGGDSDPTAPPAAGG